MAIPNGIPELTLGWGVLNWCSKWLAQPDGENKGDRWVFTDEQAMFILWFYAIDDNAQFLYRRAVLERPKGWGKSPLLAAICSCELLGPTKFSHFDNSGNPVGRPTPSAFVQIAAISEDQTDNTMALVGEMLTDSGAKDHYNLDIGLSRVLAPGKRKLARVTASFRSREGNRPTFVVMDETHLWVPAEKGPELADVLRRNLAKTNYRSIETTNAPVPGEGSVAETSHDYYESIIAGTAFDNRLLFDSREVVVEDIYDEEQAKPALIKVYGDAAKPGSGWIDLGRIWAEINDPATKEHDARRFYFNQRVQTANQWIKMPKWRLAQRDVEIKKSDVIALGFKSITKECAALVGVRLHDGAVFLLGLWERPMDARGDWEVPMSEIDGRIRKWLTKDECVYLTADPWTIQDIVGRWAVDFEGKVEEIWLNQHLRQAKLVDQFEEAILTGRAIHNGEYNLTRHVQNAHTEEVPHGWILRKDRTYSKRFITAAQAAILAFEAAQIAIENGALLDEDSTVYGF